MSVEVLDRIAASTAFSDGRRRFSIALREYPAALRDQCRNEPFQRSRIEA
jgi:hypothetical protein